jgi:hypothetical protein
MLTSRLPRELVTALDQEAERLRGTTGLPCSRTAALVVTLRRALAAQAVSAAVASPEGLITPPGSGPGEGTGRHPGASPLKPRTAPAKPKTAATPGAAAEGAVRQRFKQSGVSHRALAEGARIPLGSIGAWARGERSWKPSRLAKVSRWLEKQGSHRP